MEIDFKEIRQYVEQADRLLLTSHVHPDGDAVPIKGNRTAQECRVGHCRSTEDNAVDPAVKVACDDIK